MSDLTKRVKTLVNMYEDCIATVKAIDNQEAQDFLARRLYNITAGLIESLLLIRDASISPDLFSNSANVFVRLVEEEVNGTYSYIKSFNIADLEYFRA